MQNVYLPLDNLWVRSLHAHLPAPPSLLRFITPSKLVWQPSIQAASPHCESEGEQPQKQHVYPQKANRNASLSYLWGSWLASWLITICVVMLIGKHWLCHSVLCCWTNTTLRFSLTQSLYSYSLACSPQSCQWDLVCESNQVSFFMMTLK